MPNQGAAERSRLPAPPTHAALVPWLTASCCAAGPHLEFGGKALDASPRITSLWMLSDFTAFNGGTWVIRECRNHPPLARATS